VEKLRTPNTIDCCFVEGRRHTRPMRVFADLRSVDRIIYAIFNHSHEDWQNHTL
jgi:transposase-like protein